MPTPSFDLACEAMREYCAALCDPQSSPAKVGAHYRAAKLAIAAARANFAVETATVADCEKIAKEIKQLIRDATAQISAERRLGELIIEYKRM